MKAITLALASALLLSIGLGAAPVGATPAADAVPRFGHVFLIIGENTTYSHLKMSNAPYLLGTVKPHSAWLTHYYGTTHWSQANYVALTSGQFTKCEQQDYGIACHQNVNNVFHQLDVAGLTGVGSQQRHRRHLRRGRAGRRSREEERLQLRRPRRDRHPRPAGPARLLRRDVQPLQHAADPRGRVRHPWPRRLRERRVADR